MRVLVMLLAVAGALFTDIGESSSARPEFAPSIGRLNYAGYKERRHCTAFLIAPTIAMTAKHCLEGLQPDQVHVLLGYDQGVWREHLRSAGFWHSPDGNDIAAVCLASPAKAPPFAIQAENAEQDDQLTIYGYGLPGVHRLSKRSCRVSTVTRRGGLLLDCPVTSGTSGGPVFSSDLSSVVAVVSATRRHDSLAISVPALRPEDICS